MIHFNKELNDGLDAWYNGWYSTSDPGIVVNMFESVMNQPTDEELEEDPGLIGAVYYTVYGLQMYGMDEAVITEEDGGLFNYHEGCTLVDFCEWFAEVHGMEIEDKMTGRLEEALMNAVERT